MDVASLVATFEAKVGPGIANLEKAEKATKNVADKMGGHTKKVEGFMGKWKMGWLAISAAAIASMYALAKISPIIGGYFSSFGAVLGLLADTIAIRLTPQLDWLLMKLLDFTVWFDKLPGWEQNIIAWGAAGLLGLGMFGLAVNIAIKAITGLLAAIGGISFALAKTLAYVSGTKIGFALMKALASTGAVTAAAAALGAAIGVAIVYGMEKIGINKWLEDVAFAPLRNIPEYMKDVINSIVGMFGVLGGFILTWVRTGDFGKAFHEANIMMGKWMTSILKSFQRIFEFDWGGLLTGIQNVFTGVINVAISGFEWLINAVIGGINTVIDGLNLVPGVDIGKLGSISFGRLPYLKEGGLVLETGAALVHKGERVVPAGASNYNYGGVTVNVYPGNISSGIDVRRMADEVGDRVMEKVRRMS